MSGKCGKHSGDIPLSIEGETQKERKYSLIDVDDRTCFEERRKTTSRKRAVQLLLALLF